MKREQVVSFCRARGYSIEEEVYHPKSVVYHLSRDGARFVLKQVHASDAGESAARFQREVAILRRQAAINTAEVRLPRLVEVDERDCFHVTEFVGGDSLDRVFRERAVSADELGSILERLFPWLETFYSRNGCPTTERPALTDAREWPYSRKAARVLDGIRRAEMARSFAAGGAPLAMVHGDLVPWNVIRDQNGVLCLLDWANSGVDYPALDMARFVLHGARALRRGPGRGHTIARLLGAGGAVCGHNPEVLRKALHFQYRYSLHILRSGRGHRGPFAMWKKTAVFLSLSLVYWELVYHAKRWSVPRQVMFR